MNTGSKGRGGSLLGRRRLRWARTGFVIAIAVTMLTGCGIFHRAAIGEAPSPSTLSEVQGAISLPSRAGPTAPVVGLALGGGGLRGYAHIGVLQALEESGISVEVVAGTSAGSIIGAAYSSGRTIEEIRQAAENLDVSSLADWRLSTTSLLRGDALAAWASDMAHNMPIESMPRKFGAVAAVLDTGEAVLIGRGDVGMAIRASAAIPGSMQPVESTLGMLVDGGISSLVPVRFARAMGADVVIGVDIYCNSPPRSGNTFLSTIAKASRAQACLISSVESAEADVLIAPSVEITDMKSAAQREEAILAGYRAAKAAMPALLDHLCQVTGAQSLHADDVGLSGNCRRNTGRTVEPPS